MAITFVAGSDDISSGSTGLSVTINAPAGLQAGDVLIAALIYQASQVGAWTPPSGWTLQKTFNPSGSNGFPIDIYTKIAGGSEPGSYTWSVASNGGLWSVGLAAWRGVDSTIFDVALDNGTQSSTVASVTTVTDGAEHVVVYGTSTSWATSSLSDNSYTQRVGAGANYGVYMQSKNIASHGTISGLQTWYPTGFNNPVVTSNGDIILIPTKPSPALFLVSD